MKNFRRYEIKTEPFNGEELSGFLWDDGVVGITENEHSVSVYVESTSETNKSSFEEILGQLKNEGLIKNYSMSEEEIEDKNWNREWEQNLNVIEVSNKIVIRPSTKNYSRKENQIVVTIDPKMSFGTGEHETTKLVLTMMEKFVKPGVKILDVGSGTAVLSIAAAKLGAKYVLAIDNDEWCLLNGRENVETNNEEKRITVELKEIKDVEENDFDLILANINKHILLDIKDELKKRISENGLLILSGLLIQDKDDIEKAYSSIGFQLLELKQMNEWIGLVFKSKIANFS